MHDCKLLSLQYYAGFNVETIKYKGINFNTWDTGGRDKSVSNFYGVFMHRVDFSTVPR